MMSLEYDISFFLATKILGIPVAQEELVYIRPFTLEIVDKPRKREYLYCPTTNLTQAFEALRSKAFRFVIENSSTNVDFHWEIREYPDGVFELRLPYLGGVYTSSAKDNLAFAICKGIYDMCNNHEVLSALEIFRSYNG